MWLNQAGWLSFVLSLIHSDISDTFPTDLAVLQTLLPPIEPIPAEFMFKGRKSEPYYLSNLSTDYSHAETLLWSS